MLSFWEIPHAKALLQTTCGFVDVLSVATLSVTANGQTAEHCSDVVVQPGTGPHLSDTGCSMRKSDGL